MADLTDTLRAAVLDAAERGQRLRIDGAGSKAGMFGRDVDAQALDLTGHCGIVDYQPDELVISARAGTPLKVLNAALAERDQMLPAECPLFGGSATLGGSVACNASGAGRPWRGALRDAILGMTFINGRGELLRYGGQVMKNVAGYDISRLQAGAQGTLGVITSVTLRVIPRPTTERTLSYRLDARSAIDRMSLLAGLPGPLCGACWYDGRLFIRCAGSKAGVADFQQRWGGDPADSDAVWCSLYSPDAGPLRGDAPVWRLSVAPGAPLPAPQPDLIDWGGAQRFFVGDHDPATMHPMARDLGGRAQLWRGGDRQSEVNGTPGPTEQALQTRLKDALDPQHLFNPGRVFSWL